MMIYKHNFRPETLIGINGQISEIKFSIVVLNFQILSSTMPEYCEISLLPESATWIGVSFSGLILLKMDIYGQ